MRPRQRSGGFTLIELMIGLALGMTIVLIVGSAYQSQQRLELTRSILERQSDTMSQISAHIGREIRRAGYRTGSPINAVRMRDDGVDVRYRAPGVPLADPATLVTLRFDEDNGTIIAVRDGGDATPLHPEGAVADVVLRCRTDVSPDFNACAGGTTAVSVEWAITLAGDADLGVAPRTVLYTATSRNAVLALGGGI